MNQMQQMVAPEEAKNEAIMPVGDFIALVGGFAAFIFALLLKWYAPGKGVVGFKAIRGVSASPLNIIGIICFVTGVLVFGFAIVVLVGRFVNPNFRLVRSPGWAYLMGAAVIFCACIIGLAVPPNIGGHTAVINAGIILELIAAAGIGVGGLLKF